MTHPNPLVEYFRCPADTVRLGSRADLSAQSGYFAVDNAICYGRLAGTAPPPHLHAEPVDAFEQAGGRPCALKLPFDVGEVVENLRRERYQLNHDRFLCRATSTFAAQRVYYLLRPMLGVSVRRHLQKIRLSGWERLHFPKWPVDVSVDSLLRTTLGMVLECTGADRIPFIWFWPDGASSAVMMTHDVEGAAGHAFCDQLMDLDEAYGVKASFQLVPQGQEDTWQRTAERLRRRGFEVNLHDLNHDGYLFDNRALFLQRAKEVNRYAREFGCHGFRSGAMYREQGWYDAFEFSYDMSVPNVAHLEPQRGGCCTVMPYFVGDILELPLTTVQDYSLFYILADYSMTLWKAQIDAIRAQNGLMTFLAHPDYLPNPRVLAVYEELLGYLETLRAEDTLWITLPGEIDRWWRNRQKMTLVADGDRWRVEGPDSARARVAYATMEDGRVVYQVSTGSSAA